MSDTTQAPVILDTIRFLQTRTGTVRSIRSLARDLESARGHYLLNDYVRFERYYAGLARRTSAVALSQQP